MAIISVIIPCFNVEKYVSRLFQSLLNQTIGWSRLEMIFINDGSTDGTLNVLSRLEQEYPNHVMLINLSHYGVSVARNIGIQYATGKYISFLDSDDWVEPDMYEKMLQIITSYQCDMVICGHDRPTSETNTKRGKTGKSDSYYVVEGNEQRKQLLNRFRMSISCCDKLIHKGFLDSIQLEFPKGLQYEDQYWGFMIWFYAKSVYVLEEYLYHWYVNPNSISRNKDTNPFDRMDIQLLIVEECKKRGLYQTFRDEIDYNVYEMLFVETVSSYLRRININDINEEVVETVNKVKSLLLKEVPWIKENPYYNYKWKKSQLKNELLFKLLLDNDITPYFLYEFLRLHIRVRER